MGQDPNLQDEPLRVEELIERCMGHYDFVQRVLDKFLVRFEDDLTQLEHGVSGADLESVVRVAHRLKGAAANAAAPGLQSQAAEIEELGRAGRLVEIPRHLGQIRNEWARFVDYAAAIDLSDTSSRDGPESLR